VQDSDLGEAQVIVMNPPVKPWLQPWGSKGDGCVPPVRDTPTNDKGSFQVVAVQ
jgi:hypothetical protein